LQEPCGKINSALVHVDVVQIKISEIIENTEQGYWIIFFDKLIEESLSVNYPPATNVVNEGVNNKLN